MAGEIFEVGAGGWLALARSCASGFNVGLLKKAIDPRQYCLKEAVCLEGYSRHHARKADQADHRKQCFTGPVRALYTEKKNWSMNVIRDNGYKY